MAARMRGVQYNVVITAAFWRNDTVLTPHQSKIKQIFESFPPRGKPGALPRYCDKLAIYSFISAREALNSSISTPRKVPFTWLGILTQVLSAGHMG